MDVIVKRFGVPASNEAHGPGDSEECCATKGVISPLVLLALVRSGAGRMMYLVAWLDEGADETTDNHDSVHEWRV